MWNTAGISQTSMRHVLDFDVVIYVCCLHQLGQVALSVARALACAACADGRAQGFAQQLSLAAPSAAAASAGGSSAE